VGTVSAPGGARGAAPRSSPPPAVGRPVEDDDAQEGRVLEAIAVDGAVTIADTRLFGASSLRGRARQCITASGPV
jgi:hypothetical protein